MKAIILNHESDALEIAPIPSDLVSDTIDYDAISEYLYKELGYNLFVPFLVTDETEIPVYPWDSNKPLAYIQL